MHIISRTILHHTTKKYQTLFMKLRDRTRQSLQGCFETVGVVL